MPLAVNNLHGVQLAVKYAGVPLAELGAVDGTPLDDMHDVHFGINNNNFNGILDMGDPMEADLVGLGPRILDIQQRGGRTAEDTWVLVAQGGVRQRPPTPNFANFFIAFNQGRPIVRHNFPPGARISGHNQGGVAKYQAVATHKGPANLLHQGAVYSNGLQYGTRWSKTALEHARADLNGRIHFHLDGMGNLSQIFDKAGNFSHNVTSRELRYVYRNWERFHAKVTFYNGYTGANRAVRVEPPWMYWRPDNTTNNCTICNTGFGLFTRKHHCRKCGRIFCNACSSHTKNIHNPIVRPGGQAENGAVRVCDRCYLHP